MADIEAVILQLLSERKELGAWQSELESMSGYSKSHLSETMKQMEQKNIIRRRKEGNILNRIWHVTYYPGIVPGVFRTGILKSSEYVPLLSIIQKKTEENGLTMIIRVFNSAADMLESLSLGALEMAMAPAVAQIMYAFIKNDIRFISAIARGGSAIYRNSKSGSLTVSGSEISTMSLMARKFLDSKQEFSYRAYGDPEVALQDFIEGKFQYMAAWEPYCRSLAGNEEIEEVMNYSDLMDGFPCCISSCSSSSLKEYGEIIRNAGKEYENFCSSGENAVEISPAIEGVFGEPFRKNIIESLREYEFFKDLDPDQLVEIAREAGIMTDKEKIKSLMAD